MAALREHASLDDAPVTIVGHPFSMIGMGEQMRSHIAACRAAHIDIGVFDIFRHARRDDRAHVDFIARLERNKLPGGIRVFHINGDEVERTLAELASGGHDFDDGYNIIAPAWELPVYPKPWTELLAKFDEVWALSDFIRHGLAISGIESVTIGQSVEMGRGAMLPRRHFGLRESAFLLLHFLDLSSYAARKNPEAALALLARIVADDPFRDVQLVLKAKNQDQDAAEWCAGIARDPRVKTICEPLDSLETRSLIGACDCFVSLHRAEGFGRGLGEAMSLGRLAMGTDWSGNRDFMTAENSLLVRADLRPVAEDAYPFWQGQRWAEPDVDHAYALLRPVLDDPARGRAMALRGQADVFRTHGNRAVGLRIAARLRAVLDAAAPSARLEEETAAAKVSPARKTTKVKARA